jgi:hypothetical protein
VADRDSLSGCRRCVHKILHHCPVYEGIPYKRGVCPVCVAAGIYGSQYARDHAGTYEMCVDCPSYARCLTVDQVRDLNRDFEEGVNYEYDAKTKDWVKSK